MLSVGPRYPNWPNIVVSPYDVGENNGGTLSYFRLVFLEWTPWIWKYKVIVVVYGSIVLKVCLLRVFSPRLDCTRPSTIDTLKKDYPCCVRFYIHWLTDQCSKSVMFSLVRHSLLTDGDVSYDHRCPSRTPLRPVLKMSRQTRGNLVNGARVTLVSVVPTIPEVKVQPICLPVYGLSLKTLRSSLLTQQMKLGL